MAPLINFPIDLARTASALEGIHTQLARIGDALERLAPAPPIFSNDQKPASLGDLRHTDPATISQIQGSLDDFAQTNGVIVNSESFIHSIIKYEKEIAEAYGAEAINELPWNKAAGGLIFQGSRDAETNARNQNHQSRA